MENNFDSIFRDSNAYKDLSNRLDRNSNEIRENRNRASNGIAGLAAMSNIPTPAVAGATSFGMGVGHYDSKSALAIGASHYFDGGIAVKGSFSNSLGSDSTSVVGAGVSYTWR